MDNIKKISNRGTSSSNVKISESQWAGEKYKKYQKKQKEMHVDSYITIGRGTKNIKLADISDTKSISTRGSYISTERGTKRRKLT